MKIYLRTFALVAAYVAAVTSVNLRASSGIEGFYGGVMHLTDGTVRDMPLEISLTLTGETATIQKGGGVVEEYKVIDGAFVVDEEGGPYAFSKVTYNLDKSELDMRYSRQQLTLNPDLPSAFRLVGNIDGKGGIAGRVLSGIHGRIGTFTVQRKVDGALVPKTKYEGTWVGSARMLPEGGVVSFNIEIGNALVAVTNPPNFEFDWSPGKLGYFSWRDVKMNFTKIAIDYLRRRIYLSEVGTDGSSPILNLEADIDFDQKIMRGTLYSRYKGKRAIFGCRRVR